MKNLHVWLGIALLQSVSIPANLSKLATGAGIALGSSVAVLVGLSLLFYDCWKHNETPFMVHLGIYMVFNVAFIITLI